MYKTLLFVALFATIATTSCINTGKRVNGNGNLGSETRTIKNSEKISVLGSYDVYLEQGAPQVRIEADENLLKYIETKVDNGWLEIKTKHNYNIHTENPIKVYISTPVITGLQVHGSGNIISNQKFATTEKMKFEIAGSGNITLAVNSPKVEADIAGSGNLNIKGETKDVDIEIAGSGNFEGSELKAENAEISIAGSGDAEIFADAKLRASVSGSGDIRYRGNASVNKDIAGSGSVTKMQ